MKRIVLLLFALLFAFAALPQSTVSVKLTSKVLGEERTIFVGTPRHYDLSAARYPVLYVTDAETQFNHTLTTADFLARNGRMPSVIVVGITNTDRTRDFTPTRSGDRDAEGRIHIRQTSGGAAQFREFIEKELIPYIDASFRTVPWRVYSGHSLGGLFAIGTFLQRPDLFNGIMAVSPVLAWDDQLELRNARKFFETAREVPVTMYVGMGSEGAAMQDGFNSLRAIFRKQRAKRFSWEMQQFDDEDHGSVVLRATYFGLRKIFEDWPLPRTAPTGAVPGGWAGVKAHYRGLSEKFGFPVPVPEEIANNAGYTFLTQNRLGEAIEILKANAENYPRSANVYDSLGEAYEKNGQLDLALANYEKAMKMGAETGDANTNAFREHYENLAKRMKK